MTFSLGGVKVVGGQDCIISLRQSKNKVRISKNK